jgi:hypothetical protein
MAVTNELPPHALLMLQHPSSLRSQPIKATAALTRFLNPLTGNQSTLLQTVKQGIERGDIKTQHARRARLDELGDLVSVARTVLD